MNRKSVQNWTNVLVTGLALGLVVQCESSERNFRSNSGGAAGTAGAGGLASAHGGASGAAGQSEAGASTQGGEANGGAAGATSTGGAPGEAGEANAGNAGAAGNSSEAGAGGGGAVPRCGNGVVEAGEGCDRGAENGFELLRCAPDCSRVIEAKHIVVANTELPNARLQPSPVAAADATCKTGYKAFFAYGATRRATTSALKAVNSVDWVIRPYTYYYNDRENPVWLTDATPLLGVRNGAFTKLENEISQTTAVILTGLNPDYTTLGTDNCDGWSTIQETYSKHYGLPGDSTIGFMFSSDTIACGSYAVSFYCVEQ